MEKVRIAKFIAENSFYSRRVAESLIFEGKVKLNGNVLDTPTVKVSEEDKIEVEGKLLKVDSAGKSQRIYSFYKPTGCICSKVDERGRKTIYDLLPKSSEYQNLLYIGRLDFNTEGILLMTNSGDVKNKLEHPSAKLERVYRVKVFGKKKLVDTDLNSLRKGISFRDNKTGKKISYAPFEVRILHDKEAEKNEKKSMLVSQNDSKSVWCEVRIFEGKNREIRNAFEQIGFVVSKLARLSYGPYSLEGIKRGDIKSRPVVKSLLK